jgi:hypothetical protein
MWKAQQAHSRISISGAVSQPGISRHVLLAQAKQGSPPNGRCP